MIMTVTKSMFIDEFASMGRENQFSYSGKFALFEYFEAWEQDTGKIKSGPLRPPLTYTIAQDHPPKIPRFFHINFLLF